MSHGDDNTRVTDGHKRTRKGSIEIRTEGTHHGDKNSLESRGDRHTGMAGRERSSTRRTQRQQDGVISGEGGPGGGAHQATSEGCFNRGHDITHRKTNHQRAERQGGQQTDASTHKRRHHSTDEEGDAGSSPREGPRLRSLAGEAQPPFLGARPPADPLPQACHPRCRAPQPPAIAPS